ncbi:MAG: P27 family phage terminase small subunit [gamma proteobacterium symbiont of Taylorina sp.]|nr:P27 family phage terminase small subunit [gamma proteobacterium symbiont of Taylorina sp.]
MGTRGRQHSSSTIKKLEIVSKKKIVAPEHLTDNQKLLWSLLVETMPEEHFVKSDFPLMETYVISILLMRDAAKRIDEHGSYTDGDNPGIAPWVRVFEKQQTMIGNLAVKMRLAPVSRMTGAEVKNAPNESDHTPRQLSML